MNSDTPFGESSGVEHQALNLADGGSNPPPRSTNEHGQGRAVDYHFHTTVPEPERHEDHDHSGVGEPVDPPAFEAGPSGGSTPPTRSEPRVRCGWEMTLEAGSNFGWFQGPEGYVLSANGAVAAHMTDQEWVTFLNWASHEGPPGTLEDAHEDLHAFLDILDAHGGDDSRVQNLIAQADGYASEVQALRRALGEALQALEESTEVVERQSAELNATADEAVRLAGHHSHQARTIASLNAQLQAIATENDRMFERVRELEEEGARLSGTVARQMDTIAALNAENERLSRENDTYHRLGSSQ